MGCAPGGDLSAGRLTSRVPIASLQPPSVMPTTTPASRTEPKPLIVIVEDEVELAMLIANHLERAGMHTQVCHRATHAVKFLKKNFANLLLLDINLPDQSGFAMLEELKAADVSVPVIFLTGNVEETSKIRGLDMGGDDYVTKPFSYAELTARIRAVLRRTEANADLNVTKNVRISDVPFDFCGARITPERLEISFPAGKVEKLGRKELGILAYLNAHTGQVITRKALIHSVWGIHADVKSRSLDQYIVKVRDLFSAHGLNLNSFRTVHGIGYIFDPRGISKEGL
jgi:DNA-binding response OmpR family regulator